MNNGRDCPHGRQVGKCDTCDLIRTELELEKVTAERDAALAQVVALRKVLDYADNKLYILMHNREDVSERLLGDADKAFKVVRDTISQTATQQHHLHQVRADAGRDGFNAGFYFCTCMVFECSEQDPVKGANDYHASILAGKE